MEKTKIKEPVWCIAYIDSTDIEKVENALKKQGIKTDSICIPKVKILKKQFKGKKQYSFIPLLFNYGFIKLPYKYAKDKDYLIKLRDATVGLYSWLYIKGRTSGLKVATATSPEVTRLLQISNNISVFSKSETDKLKAGMFIILKKYPFENMPAEVVNVNHKKQEATVNLIMGTNVLSKNIKVAFDNLLYTIYDSFSESLECDKLFEGTYVNARLKVNTNLHSNQGHE
jgi:transcription antitermination factor NusG